MARIAFFTERLPPDTDPVSSFSYDLIRSLADQSHEIRVFSTYREGAELPHSHPRIEILRPFRNWGWLELPRLAPLLLAFQPEVLHFIQPRREALAGFTNAMSALPGLAPLLGRPAVISSFYDLREEDLKKHRLLLLSSDAITVSNETQLGLLTRFLATYGKEPHLSVLPVPASGVRFDAEIGDRFSSRVNKRDDESLVEPMPDALPDALAEFLESAKDLVLVPNDVSDHRELVKLFAGLAQMLEAHPQSSVVISGGWGTVAPRLRHDLMRVFEASSGSRILLTGPLSPEHERMTLAKARLIFAAALPPESLGLARILRGALETLTPVLISREQAQIDALSWRHEENALIAESPETWARTLIAAFATGAPLERIRSRLGEFSRAEAVDQPGNVMSRLYSLIAERRRSGPGASKL